MAEATVPRCTYRHGGDARKSAAGEAPAQEEVVIGSYSLARQILRSDQVAQAGFKADLIDRFGGGHVPVLFQRGEAHARQRVATARFFAPRTVATRYRALMETLSDALIAGLVAGRRAELDRLSHSLAVAVTAEIVGLTNSSLQAMSERLDSFFTTPPRHANRLAAFASFLVNHHRMAMFYLKDVRPAIRARRREPREDVISHLIAQDYSGREILTECLTYGAAGMVTTREFVVMAAWHLFERPELRARFAACDEAGRIEILEEILRLEPVIGSIYRRADCALTLDHAGEAVSIPKGTLLTLDVRAANTDPAVTGEHPYRLEPGQARAGVPQSLMSFGDGPHRCPGAHVALQETAIFLGRLFAIPDLVLERAPTLTFNPLIAGYELHNAVIAIR
jgi:cytochrome P450